MQLRGCGTALVTPFHQDGSIDDAAYNVISQGVIGAPAGPQIVSITVSFNDPDVAQSTAQAVVDQLHDDTLQDKRNQVQAAVDFYTKQVADEKTQVSVADNSIAQYLSNFPELRQPNAQSDPTLSNLQQTDALIRTRYETLIQKLDEERLSLAQLNARGGTAMRDAIRMSIEHLREKSKPGEATSPWYNAGLYAFRPSIFELTAKLEPSPRGEYELTDAIRELAQSGKKVQALELVGEWADVRDPEILAKLNRPV